MSVRGVWRSERERGGTYFVRGFERRHRRIWLRVVQATSRPVRNRPPMYSRFQKTCLNRFKNDRDVRKRSTRADLRYRSERGSWRRRAVSSRRSRLSLRPLESCWELERRGRLEELDPSWMNSRDNKTNKPVVADRRVFGAPYASLRPNPLLDCSNRYRQTRVRRPPQTWSGQDVLNDSGTVFILRGLALLGTVKVVCTFFGSLSVVEDS